MGSNNNENWLEDFIGSKEREVKVGLKWYIQLPFIIVALLTIYDVANGNETTWRGIRFGPDNVWIVEILFVVTYPIFFISMKCTSEGFYIGYNFYLFSFYKKHFKRWDEHPDLENLVNKSYFFPKKLGVVNDFIIYNFSEMIEFLSQNKRIKPHIRKKFLDYVNERKQQTIKYKILSTIIFIICIASVIFMIDLFL